MEQENKQMNSLPDNAYRELAPGEEYKPMMPANTKPKEVTPYSVTFGIIMAVIFSAAAAYLGLKVGQVFEAAIPIAIIAVGVGNMLGKKNMLGQNVIIQSIGASSGVIVAGAIFTLPALYILGLEAQFYQIFLSSLFGGFLGILLLIPFRKYFVKDMHGKYPFPEATATTEVLVSGEKKGNQAKLLAVSGLIGGLYDFCVSTFGWWAEGISTRIMGWGEVLADKMKVVFKVNTGAAVLGLGYIIGLKYAAIICAGSFTVWFVLIPFISHFADGQTLAVGEGITVLLRDMTPEQIFSNYARHIGIGGIAMAGVIGIIRSSSIIKQALGLAVSELGGKKKGDGVVERTQRDISMKFILSGIISVLIATFVFFQFGVLGNLTHTIIATLIVFVISFLFTTVAANAIAIVGSNPVSGMTLMTLILSSLVLVSAGLSGTSGMMAAMIIGGVVCTALSMAGGFITDLKIGYWLGTTPARQEGWKFLGTAVSAATIAGVMMVLNQTYGFVGENALVAPQANAMAAVIKPLMEGGATPWLLYFAGAALALILTMIGVPALAFALGMFIPLDLNTPLLIGGLVSWYVGTRSKDENVNKARRERGTLIASGFIAGGALMGVISAILKYCGADWFITWSGAEVLAVVMYILIILYFIYDSMKAKLAD
ncbi:MULTISPECIES: OPT family oligopeptide transporter [Butyricimonas]|jgi:putative OPT family oligopeptide transporter|uniref:Putative OPT family oligopeptide transporter n=1 Tax=Butyricimonas faecihominis TaxID=1472416 RepID=A0A7W6N0H3_9BACT|nr:MULTISPECIES: oligopeptide transporter, OPT family [Butyricimonas]MBS6687817.1 oligopeptide transporter, OPT family [Sanguibacteroides justesenii]KAB1504857.1 oligopeptide transporter, OPT family [Butyricimonas faecihominis]MBB4027862.1 putative OPT family oligopeptide transporter [Butyricimonas faecihominis]WOF08870.1 oligopeptide transporter, OPT family [Butyricimonas faecihominis]BEI58898.1 oligopeptide transporter, OPT family [Butyricimonas faecihominis]